MSLSQSSSANFPVLRFWASMPESMANSLFTSCSLLISNENIMHGRFFFIATYSRIFNTNAVFPMEGLAAISIKSEG